MSKPSATQQPPPLYVLRVVAERNLYRARSLLLG
jgi:hypothetical protein